MEPSIEIQEIRRSISETRKNQAESSAEFRAELREIAAQFKEVRELFKETDREFKEIAAKFKETDARFKETDKAFKETDAKFKETDKAFKETDARFKETDKAFKETDARFKETDKAFKETDAKFKETDAELKEVAARFKETDAKFKETDARDKEAEARDKKLEQRIKEAFELFEGQWGKLIESLIEGDLIRLLQERGIKIYHTTTRRKGSYKGTNYEFDIIALNGDELVVVEVKTTLRIRDVQHFMRKMEQVKTWLPEYKRFKVYGAVAYLRAEQQSIIYAERQRLFVIKATGNSASIINDANFIPKAF